MAVSGINSNNFNVFSNTINGTGQSSAQKQQIDFLAMLMVQLKNQNPMDPYDNQQFAAQLATFSQLEQLTDIKGLLDEQANVIAVMAMSMENTALPGIIGKYASAASKTLDFDGINPSEIGFKTTLPAVSGKTMIYDSAGKLVKTINLDASQCKIGEHFLEWDGYDEAGNRLLPGKYRVEMELTESDGGTYKPETYTIGIIEAVRFKTAGTVVVINGIEVPLGSINDVRETPF